MSELQGIVGPLLTPFEPDGKIARDLWCRHAKWLIAQGADFLSPFGTTGEALSVPPADRMAAIEWLVEAGIPASRLMPGTGLNSVEETVRLSSHASELGCAAVMMLPPFFYKAADEDGLFRHFETVIDHLGEATSICLYNIPQNTGVPITPSLAHALNARFPDCVTAYKDSSGDWENTVAVMAKAPRIAMFPATEVFLTRGLEHGAVGCVSATVNLNCRAMRNVFDAVKRGEDAQEAQTNLDSFRKIIQDGGLIGGAKAVLAAASGDRRWLTLRPPHMDATLAEGEALLAALGPLGAHLSDFG